MKRVRLTSPLHKEEVRPVCELDGEDEVVRILALAGTHPTNGGTKSRPGKQEVDLKLSRRDLVRYRLEHHENDHSSGTPRGGAKDEGNHAPRKTKLAIADACWRHLRNTDCLPSVELSNLPDVDDGGEFHQQTRS